MSNQRCAKCGACTVVCPVFRASGGKEFYSGRGKKHLLEVMGEDVPSAIFEDIFSKCLLCGACVTACSRDVDIPGEVRKARSGFSRYYGEHGYRKFLAKKVLEKPELLRVVRTFGISIGPLLQKTLPVESGLRLQLAMLEPTIAKDQLQALPQVTPAPSTQHQSLNYFPGCTASHLYPEIMESCRELFAGLGYQLATPKGLACCGMAMDASGDSLQATELAKKNIEVLEGVAGKIMASCGSCYAHLSRYPEILSESADWKRRAEAVCARLVEMNMLLMEVIPSQATTTKTDESAGKLRVFYHDPCHLRNDLSITREPRSLLSRYSSVQLLELPDGPQCCGQGGLFHLGAPELAAAIRDDLADKVLELQPDLITTSCSGCLMQWKSAIAASGKDILVLHLATLLHHLQTNS